MKNLSINYEVVFVFLRVKFYLLHVKDKKEKEKKGGNNRLVT